MQIKMAFKNLDSTDGLKAHVEDKSEKLKKFFHGHVDVQWFFSVVKTEQIAEIKVHGDTFTFVAEDRSEDLYASIDSALDKISTQIRKKKEQLTEHHKS